jgi:hypothetical protein
MVLFVIVMLIERVRLAEKPIAYLTAKGLCVLRRVFLMLLECLFVLERAIPGYTMAHLVFDSCHSGCCCIEWPQYVTEAWVASSEDGDAGFRDTKDIAESLYRRNF